MAEFLILVTALLEEEEKAAERKRLLKSLRDKSDPFSMKEFTFIQNFGFPKSFCQALIQDMEKHDKKTSIPLTLRFLACLYFYKHGSYQKEMENSDTIPMSQSSISRSIHTVSELIVNVMAGKEIQFPNNEQDISDVKKGFETMFGLKDVVGAIDCTHVVIKQPTEADCGNPGNYVNKEGHFSIHLEVICDHRLMFRAANAKFPGSCSRADIWTNTPIRIQLYKNYKKQSDTNTFLLAGKGYPVEPWLLTPLPEPALSTPLPEPLDSKEIKFNKLHAKGHYTITKAVGALRTRFRCLSKHRLLHYSPLKTSHILYACITLHNILLKHGMAADIDLEELPEHPTQLKPPVDNLEDFYNSDASYESDRDEETFKIEEGKKARERYIKTL